MRNSGFNTNRVYCTYDIRKEKITYLKNIMEGMSEKTMGYCNISNITYSKKEFGRLCSLTLWNKLARKRRRIWNQRRLGSFYILFKIIYIYMHWTQIPSEAIDHFIQ